jgi:8-oxo-dGTP pyrophosphatase MutT (NUDIX family)
MTGEGRPLPRAASAILLREAEGDEPFEVYMLRRPDDARFAPGVHSFTGGVLDVEDFDVAREAVRPLPGGITVEELHRRLADKPIFASPDAATSAALLVCAARELFEEAGVLIAREEGDGLVPLDNEVRWARAREDLLAGRLAFGDLLRADGLTLAPDDLIYYSHWITPEGSRIRFDTHFFLAVLPPGQLATHWPGEMAAGEWLGPHAGLERHARGALPMFPVQTRHLERFATFDSLDALLAHARTKPVPPVLPTMGTTGREAPLPEEIATCW